MSIKHGEMQKFIHSGHVKIIRNDNILITRIATIKIPKSTEYGGSGGHIKGDNTWGIVGKSSLDGDRRNR